MGKISRNAPCPCGSGKKYKNCHLGKPLAGTDTVGRSGPQRWLPIAFVVVGVALGTFLMLTKGVGAGLAVGASSIVLAGIVAVLVNPPPPSGGSKDAGAINFGG